jgi:anion-transporting  ArsA/GET3 family ATPase
MQNLVSSTHVAPAILAALKLDLKFVKRIEIDLDVDSLPFCRVEFYPTLEQLEDVSQALETEMKSYALIEVSDETQNVEECSC